MTTEEIKAYLADLIRKVAEQVQAEKAQADSE
jgi:hypothetical protein